MEPLLLLVIFLAVMTLPMFWMSSRQRKAQRLQQEKLAALEVGDEVRTHSGFYGIIAEQYGDVVILETESGAQTKWARLAIAQKVEDDFAPVEDEEAEIVETEDVSDGAVADGTGTGTSREVPGVHPTDDRPAGR